MSMNKRIRQALIWYDSACDKYENAVKLLKEYRESKKQTSTTIGTKISNTITVSSKLNSADGTLQKLISNVRRYEEKLSRASAVLNNITSVTMALKDYEDAEEIILSDDYDDEEEEDK